MDLHDSPAAGLLPLARVDTDAVEHFAEIVATDQARATAGTLAYIGDRLGLWAALAGAGPVTSAELADLTGLHERYLREWLATQTAAGYLTYDAGTGRFCLPPAHAAVLADESSPAALAGGFESIAAFWAVADRVADAFRDGGGVAWRDQDPRLFSGVDRFFSPLYKRSLVTEWLPALDAIVDVLERGGRVLDVGCGLGTSAILMAQAYPARPSGASIPTPGRSPGPGKRRPRPEWPIGSCSTRPPSRTRGRGGTSSPSSTPSTT